MRRRRVRKGTEEIGREEGYDKVLWKGPRARSRLLLALPVFDHTSSFLALYQLEGNRRGEGTGK